MSKNYQVVEPPVLAGLFSAPRNFDLAVVVFTWLIDQLRIDLKEELIGAELEVIRAEYHGAYPAIGIHYDAHRKDLGPLVEAAIAKLINERTMFEFISFVESNKTNWKDLTDELVRSKAP